MYSGMVPTAKAIAQLLQEPVNTALIAFLHAHVLLD